MSDVVEAIVNHSIDRIIGGTAILAAVVYFGAVGIALGQKVVGDVWERLCKEVSTVPPEFDPKSPGAASVTALTSVLGTLISGKLLPTSTTYFRSADTYTYLNVFFLALLGLALLFYFSLGRRVGVYLFADWLIVWGAFGAVISFDLALLELTGFTASSRIVFALLVTLALVAVTYGRVWSTLDVLRARAETGVDQLLPAGKPWQVG